MRMYKKRGTYLTFTFPRGRSFIGTPETSLESIDFSCSFLKVTRAAEPEGDGIESSLLLPPEAPDLSK